MSTAWHLCVATVEYFQAQSQGVSKYGPLWRGPVEHTQHCLKGTVRNCERHEFFLLVPNLGSRWMQQGWEKSVMPCICHTQAKSHKSPEIYLMRDGARVSRHKALPGWMLSLTAAAAIRVIIDNSLSGCTKRYNIWAEPQGLNQELKEPFAVIPCNSLFTHTDDKLQE